MTSNADVVVVGSCMTDLVSYTSRLPKPGETIQGKKFSIGFGGKGANQCIVAARLGAKTAMVAKVGDDTFGHNYIQNFKDNSVFVGHVGVTQEAGTGVAPICVDDEGQNSIVIVPGANLILSEDDVMAASDLFKSAKVMICQLEVKPSISLAALKLARQYGVWSIFNPAPAQKDLSSEFFTVCDVLCANETEAEILTGLPVTNVKEAEIAVACLLDLGSKVVIVTLGSLGSVFATQEDRTCQHTPAQSVTAVDTTGAGDAYVGALAYYMALMPDLDLHEVIKRSTMIASRSVQAPGTQSSYPWKKDISQSLFES